MNAVARVIHIEQAQSLFGPQTIVCIINRGATVDADPGNLESQLSDSGITKARQLAVAIDAMGPQCRFKAVIAGAGAASKTAKEIFQTGYGGIPWIEGVGHEYIAPRNPADARAVWDSIRDVTSRAVITMLHPNEIYAACKLLCHGPLERFRAETRANLLAIPGIRDIRRLAIVSNDIMCNAIAEAIFPHHARVLDAIALQPCDMIVATTKSIEHFPLLRLPH